VSDSCQWELSLSETTLAVVSGVALGLSEVCQSGSSFAGRCDYAAPRFVFPPLPISSHIPLIAAHGSSAMAKGPSPGLVSNDFGSVELRNQPTSTRQNSFLFDDTYLGATDLGERIRLSTPASLVS
jgi:hypothetical protein